jgi:Phosphoesterase family
MSSSARRLLTLAIAACWAVTGLAPASASPRSAVAAHYDHVFVIVEENHSFTDVIGNPAAPNLNALASAYGIATNYFGVTHPSEPNYVALLGGSPFTVNSDDAYYVQRVAAPSLISELDQAHVSWKAYLQGLPHPGYQGICYPANCNGEPDKDPLYVSKHDGIQNYTTSLNAADWSRQVPIDQLGSDLRSGNVPAFNWVIPDECHDQHGDPPYCIDSGNTGGGDPQDQRLVAFGDHYLGHLVAQITGAAFWAKGNNAIDIVYDEGDSNAHGGGRVANIVVTSHGPRHLQAPAFYSHYSLLQTIQRNFGLPCLQNTCDTATVKPLTPLFAVTGSAAMTFKPLPMPNIAALSPTPKEPVRFTSSTASGAGWTVQRAPVLGTNDNSFGAVSAVSPRQAWAVGNFLPDTQDSNQDATLATAARFDGSRWVHTPVPNTGPNFNTLFGVAATSQKAWAVGVALNRSYFAHSLIEAWNGTAWKIARTPRLSSLRDVLFSAAAASPSDVWAVGERQDKNKAGTFHTLAEHWNGHRWAVVPTPDPGATGNCLFGVAAAGPDDVWAVGQSNGRRTDTPLAEHWNGRRWTVVRVPSAGLTGSLLQGVAISGRQVWAVGQSDDATAQARPLVEHLSQGQWTAQQPGGLGSGFSDITGVAVVHRTVWLVGSALDEASGDQLSVVARNSGSGWRQVAAPNPGNGDRILGGISAAGGTAWAAGAFDSTTGRAPLIEVNRG